MENSVADALIEKLIKRTGKLKLGPGENVNISIGPVSGRHQFDNILHHIEMAKSQGAQLVFGGKRSDVEALERGCFIEPTIFDHVDENMAIA